MKNSAKSNEAPPQGRLQLTCESRTDFEQEVVAPGTASAFHGDAVFFGMLLQEREGQAVEPGKVFPPLLVADARIVCRKLAGRSRASGEVPHCSLNAPVFD